MIILSKPAKVLEEKEASAVFEIEGLYPGYGVTIGNTLRRVLLSSLGGAAVTQVKVRGVPHEFSTLPGVLEDSIVLLLNLKQMRFKVFGDEPQTATLKIKGEKEVKGSDFEFPSQVKLINKNVHIATLTSKSAELEIEILIARGIGYVQAKDLKKEKGEIGVLPLDAIFTPIKKVNYSVQHMRVGDRTDFDKLTFEIETDGSISPQEAFLEASDILTKQFQVLVEDLKKQPKKEDLPAGKAGQKEEKRSSKKKAAKEPKKKRR